MSGSSLRKVSNIGDMTQPPQGSLSGVVPYVSRCNSYLTDSRLIAALQQYLRVAHQIISASYPRPLYTAVMPCAGVMPYCT